MRGEVLLSELLALARRQREALLADDLAEFDRLADRRDALAGDIQTADWGDRELARQLAQELLACDRRNEVALREHLALVAQELSSLQHAATSLRGYRRLAETDRPSSVLVDRSA